MTCCIKEFGFMMSVNQMVRDLIEKHFRKVGRRTCLQRYAVKRGTPIFESLFTGLCITNVF